MVCVCVFFQFSLQIRIVYCLCIMAKASRSSNQAALQTYAKCPDEDWTSLSRAEDRRKLQNRLNQRARSAYPPLNMSPSQCNLMGQNEDAKLIINRASANRGSKSQGFRSRPGPEMDHIHRREGKWAAESSSTETR